MKLHYQNLKDRLFAKLNAVPALAWCDVWNHQLQYLDAGEELPIVFPAIFIEFSGVNWETQKNHTQRGQALWRFHIVCEVYDESYANPNGGSINQNNALEMWDFVQRVHEALQAFQGDSFAPLDRVGEIVDSDHDMLIDTILEYTTIIYDATVGDQLVYDQTATITDTEVTPNSIPVVQPPVTTYPEAPYIIP